MSAPRTLWLASYPKSGNTWLRAMYTAWLQDGLPSLHQLQGGEMPSVRATFDQALGIPSTLLSPAETDHLRPLADAVFNDASDASGRLLVRKVHDHFLTNKGQPVVSTAVAVGAIYVVRDPRDVALSLAHHSGQTVGYIVGYLGDHNAVSGQHPDEVAPQLRQRLGSWSDHVLSWAEQVELPVEVVRYEDCAMAPHDVLRKLLLMGQLATVEERLRRAAASCHFDVLRRMEQEVGFPEAARPIPFFRRGAAQGWRGVLDGYLQARIEQDHSTVMKRYGYL